MALIDGGGDRETEEGLGELCLEEGGEGLSQSVRREELESASGEVWDSSSLASGNLRNRPPGTLCEK